MDRGEAMSQERGVRVRPRDNPGHVADEWMVIACVLAVIVMMVAKACES